MKDNSEYGFNGITVSRKHLLSRVELICFEFKKNLSKFKKSNDASNNGGDKSMGHTRIDLKKKFTKVHVERDHEGNIIYPIVISPSLSVLNLGVIDW